MSEKIIKSKYKNSTSRKSYTMLLLVILFFLNSLFLPVGVDGRKIKENPELPPRFHLYYGFWGAEFLIENQYIIRSDLQDYLETNNSADFKWKSVAHLYLDFSYVSENLYSCSVEFKILNITRNGVLMFKLSENRFYMPNNFTNGVFIPIFFDINQNFHNKDIFCAYNSTINILMENINYMAIDHTLKGTDYSYYDIDLNVSRVDVPYPDNTLYEGMINSVLLYDYSNGFLIWGNLPFYCFENLCRLAIPTFNSTNFSANPELKLASTNLNFTISNSGSFPHTSNSLKDNPYLTEFIMVGIVFGVPLIIVITKSIRKMRK